MTFVGVISFSNLKLRCNNFTKTHTPKFHWLFNSQVVVQAVERKIEPKIQFKPWHSAVLECIVTSLSSFFICSFIFFICSFLYSLSSFSLSIVRSSFCTYMIQTSRRQTEYVRAPEQYLMRVIGILTYFTLCWLIVPAASCSRVYG